jgi:hypothetical protein
MWSRRAKSRCLQFSVTDHSQHFVGEHDGYTRLPDPVIHRRELIFNAATRQIDILDIIQCAATHKVDRRWHFSEQLTPLTRDGTCVVTAGQFTISIEPGEVIEQRVYRGGSLGEGGWVSRSFGQKAPCTTVQWTTNIPGSTTLRTRFRVLGSQ